MAIGAGRDGRWDAREATLALLAARAPDATVCPSEAARALAVMAGAGEEWHEMMPIVHAAIDQLVADGAVRLSWKGKALQARAGPYRIGHALGARDRDADVVRPYVDCTAGCDQTVIPESSSGGFDDAGTRRRLEETGGE